MRSGRVITEADRQRARDLIKRVDAKIKKELAAIGPAKPHRWGRFDPALIPKKREEDEA